MAVNLSMLAGAGAQFFDNNGVILSGGRVYTYAAGTTTPQTTYTTSAGTVAHTNPIVLNSAGRVASGGEIWLTDAVAYKFVLETSAAVTIATYDNITGNSSGIYAAFAASSGSSLVGYIQTGTGAVATTVQTKLRQVVSINDFGAVGNGTTDDTAAIQAAIDSLGALGGTVYIPNTMQCYVAGNLTVNPNCGIEGPHIITGSPQNNVNIPYASVGGAIRLASSATITMKGGSALQGLLIYRYGMTFPAANDSLFAGTAIMIEFDDVAIFQCQIMGFEFAIKSTVNAQRARISDCNLDNKNGIYIDTCPDILRINNVQCWPFAFGGLAPGTRSGTAFTVINNADWAKLTNCFSWGYARGYQIIACNNVTLVSCGADGPITQTGSIGFEVSGASNFTNFLACQTGGREVGYRINTTSANITFIADSSSFSCQNYGVLIDDGIVNVLGGSHQGGLGCITTNNVASIVSVEGVTFNYLNTIGTPIVSSVVNANIYVGQNNLYLNYPLATVVSTVTAPVTLVTAATLNLPAQGSYFRISGAGTISNIAGGSVGRTLTLQFLTANTIVDNSGNLQLAGNLAADNNTVLQLIYNGTNWLEISRSING